MEDTSDLVKDPLVHKPQEEWHHIQDAFKSDLPRGASGYWILETQRDYISKGLCYGFKVFCPFGDPWNGIVAVNEKDKFYEIIIQCPKDDTSKLENALKTTNRINWKRKIIIPFAPGHVLHCIEKILNAVNVEIEVILPSHSFILYWDCMPTNISLPPSITFAPLSLDHAELVNSTWPHRYPGSVAYFHLLIQAKSGFGLFLNQTLISWVFINEAGTLGHLYTIEKHRKTGYAELLLKLICNMELGKGKKDYIFAFCVKGNEAACKLYRKVCFQSYAEVGWCYLQPPNCSTSP